MGILQIKSFLENFSADPEVLSAVNATPRTAFSSGRTGVLVNQSNGSEISIHGNPGPTLLTRGSTVLFFGFHTDAYLLRLMGTYIHGFNSSSGTTTFNGKSVSQGFHWVEYRIERLAASSYNIQVRIDGSEYVNGTFDGTVGNNLWSSSAMSILFTGYITSSNLFINRIADFVTWDNIEDGSGTTSWMGPMQVNVIRPNGSGAASQWLGSDGNSVDNYLLVDENPASNTDYVESSIDGQRDLYTFESLPAGLKPLAVKPMFYAQKNGSALRSFKPVVRQSDGTNTQLKNGSEKTLSQVPTFYRGDIEPKNLLTNEKWTAATLAQLQFGVETSTPTQ